MKLKNNINKLSLYIFIIVALHLTPYTLHVCYGQTSGRITDSMASPSELKAGETIFFKALVKNEGVEKWEAGAYSCFAEIYDPKRTFLASTEPLYGTTSVDSGGFALFQGISFPVPVDYSGQYSFRMIFRHGNSQPVAGSNSVFTVIPRPKVDLPPEIQFMSFGLSAVQGEDINLKLRITDDKGVSRVRVYCQFPGAVKRTQDMDLFSGTRQDGVWIFKTASVEETGKASFQVEATDTKPQTSKTEYQFSIISGR